MWNIIYWANLIIYSRLQSEHMSNLIKVINSNILWFLFGSVLVCEESQGDIEGSSELQQNADIKVPY